MREIKSEMGEYGCRNRKTNTIQQVITKPNSDQLLSKVLGFVFFCNLWYYTILLFGIFFVSL